MARKDLNHRIQFLDGVFRITETSSNDVTRVISEIDIRDAEAKAGLNVAEAIEQMQVPPEQKMMVTWTTTHFGERLNITGWDKQDVMKVYSERRAMFLAKKEGIS